ncbi:vWA domain-containing protein [Mycobacterium sp. NPDC003449]
MTWHPVLPPALLALLAAAVILACVLALRRVSGSGRSARWRWAGLTAAAVLLLLAAARPVLGGAADRPARIAGATEPSIFLVVDRSADMRATDRGGRARIAAARADIEALIDHYPKARFAVIAFDSRASLDWPLSEDTWSLRPVIDELRPYPSAPGATAQTDVGAAGTALRYQLISAVQQYPRAENLVFYLGAGAAQSQAQPREFEIPEGSVDGGAVLGYGTDAGAGALRRVAGQLDVPYVSRADDGPLTGELPAARAGQRSSIAPAPAGIETYWVFALGAGALILIELYLVLREFRRTRFGGVDVTS